jgi:TonB-dependent receptor
MNDMIGNARKFSTIRIILLASSCMLGAQNALAQTTATPAGEAPPPEEEIVVTGSSIRDSIEKSLEIQRRSDNVVNAIASDTIGRFPDSTAAGALARLPGVGVQRDQGQERYIQIRGAPTRWTTVAFDGINILGAEDRIFRFDSVPAVQIARLELNKTLLPNMPAESLAGRVNIVTYSPIDNPGFHFSGDVGRGYVDLANGPVENYSGRLSWGNGRFGISLSASRFSFVQQTDNSEPRFDAIGIAQLRITKYIIKRQTESYSGRVQWEPADGHRFSLQHLNTKFNDFEQRNQLRWQYSNAFSGTRNFETASLIGVPLEAQFENGVFENGLNLTVLNGQHEFDGWNVNWDLAYAQTRFDADIPLTTQTVSTALTVPTVANALLQQSIDLRVNAVPGGIPFSTLYDTVAGVGGAPTRGVRQDAVDQRQFTRERAAEGTSFLRTKSYTGKLDIDREWSSFGADAKISFGFQFDDRKQSNDIFNQLLRDGTTVGTLDLRPTAATLNVPWTPFELITREAWDTRFPFGFTVNYIDNITMNNQLQAIQTAARAANAAGTGNFAVIGSDAKLFNTVDERVIAGYVMNRWSWGPHTVVAGLRVEDTRNKTVGSAVLGTVITPASFSSRDTAFFPSLHYTFDASDKIKLRAAFITGQARASLDDLRATININDTNRIVTGGNPFLKSEKAYGFDLSAEWYFAPASLLAVSAYHREVSDVLFDASTTVADTSYNFGGINRQGYVFTSVLNGQNGRLSGIEFTYYHPFTFLPGALSGLGFQGSAAFNTGSFRTPGGEKVEFPGTSKRIFSASVFYEKYGFSGRISYQNRSAWLDEVFPSGSAANSNLYWGSSTRWDASVRYDITKNFALYADINNMTDERGTRYQGTPNRPYEIEGFGRRFLFGVRANF